MDSIILSLLLFGLSGLLVYIFLVFNFNYWKKRGVSGPKPKPLFGNLPNVILQKRSIYYDIFDIYREYKYKERFVGIFNVRQPQLLIIDPRLIQEIMVSNSKKFHLNEIAQFTDKEQDPIFSRNTFLLTGEEWKEKRAEITPALTMARIKASYPIMHLIGAKMTQYLESETIKPPADGFNAKELAARFTTEVVANCIYGIEAEAFSGDHCQLRDMGCAIADSTAGILTDTVGIILVSMIPKSLLQLYKRPFVKKEIQDFFTDLMNRAIEIRKESKSDRIDFLNYLIQLQKRKNLTNLDMAAHTLTFFIDGFETSSLVISNCMRLLAQHKSVQDKLRDEIKRTISEEGEITFEKLHELPYLDQCINETLRMHAPAAAINKICTESCVFISSNEKPITIEKGTVVTLPYHAIHTDSDYYENPEKFDPDRFNPENGGTKKYKDMGVFLPFGDGPRICLGMRFALSQTKVAIVEFVRNWEMTINPKTPKEFVIGKKEFLAIPEGGTWIDFTRVKNR